MSYVERYVVAITALGTPIEVEAKALAADLGTIAYEERLKLAAGFPAVVLSTTASDAAQALGAKLRARGHAVVVCRASDVVRAGDLIAIREPAFDDAGLTSAGQQIPYDDIAALVRARHVRQVGTTEVVTKKKFDAARAILTGGLVMRKTVRTEVSGKAEELEQVLYIFRASGDTPWLLREHSTNYSGLGAALAPTAGRNFALVVERLRARAPRAKFDDSLVRRPTIEDVDLYAHLVAAAR